MSDSAERVAIMNVRTLCLAMLTCGEASGYEIKKQSVEGDWRYFVEASFGSIYPALKALESDGLVTVREEADPGKPPRKVYAITEAGRAALAVALLEAPAPDTFRSPFLLVAMCAQMVGPDHMSRLIAERMKVLEAEIAHMRACLAECGHEASAWTLRYGIDCFENSLRFCREHGDELVAIAARRPAMAAAE